MLPYQIILAVTALWVALVIIKQVCAGIQSLSTILSTSLAHCTESCPIGTCVEGDKCDLCLPGTFANETKSTHCTSCAPGSYNQYTVCSLFVICCESGLVAMLDWYMGKWLLCGMEMAMGIAMGIAMGWLWSSGV